jgi:hypothetical protein
VTQFLLAIEPLRVWQQRSDQPPPVVVCCWSTTELGTKISPNLLQIWRWAWNLSL